MRKHRAVSDHDISSPQSVAGLSRNTSDAGHLAEQNLLWQRVSHRLKTDLGEAKWRAWIKPLLLEAFVKDHLILRASTSFLRDRVHSNYLDKIRLLAAAQIGAQPKVRVLLAREGKAQPYSLSNSQTAAGENAAEMMYHTRQGLLKNMASLLAAPLRFSHAQNSDVDPSPSIEGLDTALPLKILWWARPISWLLRLQSGSLKARTPPIILCFFMVGSGWAKPI